MLKVSWAICACISLPQAVLAQAIPSAGGQMQQIPSVPNLPGSKPQAEWQPSSTGPPASGSITTFIGKRLDITGARAYAESALVLATGFESGQLLDLNDLQAMADKITQHYRRDGYLVARAYLPAQEIKDGVVTIAVLEGQYGQVRLNNTSTLDSDIPDALLDGLNPGDVIAKGPLEDRLLLLTDVPGVVVRSTLVPGASVGLSDLIVEIKPGARISGSVDADNAGNRYTGANRIGATFNLNNPGGRGDIATLRALTSGTGLQYARLSYQIPVGKSRVGVAYSDLEYALGDDFRALDAKGYARIAALFGTLPLVRSRKTNLHVGLTLENKEFRDSLQSLSATAEKRAQVATATVFGDHHDSFGPGGVSSYSLAWFSGKLDIQSFAERTLDASTTQSNGHYGKLAFSVSRMQQSRDNWTFIAAITGQLASKNLDVSEKMELGGMYGVRAYPEGEAYADEGTLLTLEARKELPLARDMGGQFQVAAFLDAGAVKLNRVPWMDTANGRHLSGAGLGMYWTRLNDFSVRMFYAWKLGTEVAISSPDMASRLWVQAVKYF